MDKTAVEALIKQAVGFDTERNDQIEVVPAKLAATAPLEAVILRHLDGFAEGSG